MYVLYICNIYAICVLYILRTVASFSSYTYTYTYPIHTLYIRLYMLYICYIYAIYTLYIVASLSLPPPNLSTASTHIQQPAAFPYCRSNVAQRL